MENKVNRIGICHWSIPDGTGEAGLALAARVGLDGVELDMGSYEEGLPLSSSDMRRRYQEWRVQYGLVYPSLAVNALCQHGMAVPEARPEVEKCLSEAVNAAIDLSIPIVQLPSFVAGDIVDEVGFRSTVESLRYVCHCAEGTGLIIGSENALTAAKQFELLELVNSESLRLYFDTRNLWQMKSIPSAPVLDAVYDQVCEVHVKDGIDDGPWKPLGQGNGGFDECMEILVSRGYGGWIVLENGYADIAKDTGLPVEAAIEQDIAIVRSRLAS